jgi:hypothetical protein
MTQHEGLHHSERVFPFGFGCCLIASGVIDCSKSVDDFLEFGLS